MEFTPEAIIYYLVLLDSVIANVLSWCCRDWYQKYFSAFAKRIPLSKAWCAWYLILVLWVGYALRRLGVI